MSTRPATIAHTITGSTPGLGWRRRHDGSASRGGRITDPRIGASGFVGRRLVKGLMAEGHSIRCFARNPSKITDLVGLGCEVVQGDITDPASLGRAMTGAAADFIAIHTLSPQPGAAGARFMDVERLGIENIAAAARVHGVSRAVYLTAIGSDPGARSEWLRERWATEQLLLDSGLDATVIAPGQIVGRGGQGFDVILANARRRVTLLIGDGRQKLRAIAVDDLVHYLIGVLKEPRAFGHRFDVGSDDVLSTREMIDIVADVLGRSHPFKLPLPRHVLGLAAPLIERAAKIPPGAMKGLLDCIAVDLVGDPRPIRAVLPQLLLSFREAVAIALRE